jgi:hypothetical protein
MFRRIGFLKGLSRFELVLCLVLHTDAARGRKQLSLSIEFEEVCMACDVPEALSSIGHFEPGHWVFPA